MSVVPVSVKSVANKEIKMPKFYRKNKKRIDPRYFLRETINRDKEEIKEAKGSQEYLAAQGQAPFTDGNMKTSVAAAKRRAIQALRKKGGKGPVKFHKPHPKSGYQRGDKVVVTVYVGTPERDSQGFI